MPIAFDSPASAPHGTLPTHRTRGQDDDAAALDLFTQFLLAASTAPDAANADAPVAARKDPAAGDASAADAPLLMLPLPNLPTPAAPVPGQVTIVATEKRATASLPATPVTAGASSLVDTAAGNARDVAARSATARTDTPPGIDSAATASGQAPDAHKAHVAAPQAAPSLLATLATLAEVDKATSARPLAERTNAMPAPVTAPPPQPVAAATALHVETVAAPAFTPGWQDETVAKLAHIVVTRNERAELKLNPAELGPVSVRVDLNAGHASLAIVASSPETRSALEQSLPQLRDLLASQGITLGQATVHDGSAQRDPSAQPWTTPGRSAGDAGSATSSTNAETVHRILRRADRLVDVFA
jgi:flagellar hook-length control protein FliK